jgi:tetratricopeptide (TPR) repeat protein
MIAFTADQFGFPKITRALQLWGEGKRTADVIREAFGVSPAEYDARNRAWILGRLGRYEGQYTFAAKSLPLEDARKAAAATPASAAVHVSLARALLRSRKVDEAAQEVDSALKLDPNDKDAHFIASKVAMVRKDAEGQDRHLRAIQAAGGDGYVIQLALAELAEGRPGKKGMREALEAAHRFDPTQPEPLHGLYDLARSEHRDDDALAALREVARLDQHDRASWGELMRVLVERKLWAEAKRVGESAIYVDVERAGLHVDYARSLAALGDHGSAAFELESALLCDAKAPEKATAHALLAREKLALGDAVAARSHRDEALKIDPENAEARSLVIKR